MAEITFAYMTQNPLISVVIPLYNQEKYIAESVNSVLAQTYTHFQLIIVDDGSTDASLQAIAMQQADARVQIHRQANAGVSAARNAGIALAQGAYTALLDADDYWCPNYLQSIVHIIQSHESPEIIACRYASKAEHLKCETTSPNYLPVQDYFTVAMRNTLLSASSVIVLTSHLKQHLFDNTIRMGEDTDVWFRLNMGTARLFYITEPLVYYRMYKDHVQQLSLRPLECTLMAQTTEKYATEMQRDQSLIKAVSLHNYNNLVPYYLQNRAAVEEIFKAMPYRNLWLEWAYRSGYFLEKVFPNKNFARRLVGYTYKIVALWHTRATDKNIYR
ncbi:MAG: glycosyltransferase family 2 protein [Weeksellaceae bacterium]|nr:glycosyltransferase family 2 protein [Weeksellaceae bacterium]